VEARVSADRRRNPGELSHRRHLPSESRFSTHLSVAADSITRMIEGPLTVAATLDDIQSGRLLVPAIQRRFVWKDSQIVDLFDSLMRGYPMGTLLVWRASGEAAKKWPWFGCHTDLHRGRPGDIPRRVPTRNPIDSLLDGQQRLTALNIGVHGSITTSPASEYQDDVKRVLWLDLAHVAPLEPEPGASRYRFAFHPPTGAPADGSWVQVSAAARLKSKADVRRVVRRLTSSSSEAMVAVLDRLRRTLSVDRVVTWHVVANDDMLDVLDIFVRANSQGTDLGYDSMVLAAASAVWTDHDPVEEVPKLRQHLVDRFNLPVSQARLVKTGLVLSSSTAPIGFTTTTLTRARLRAIDQSWDEISEAVKVAVEFLYRVGLQRRTLTAENVVIPLACYFQHRRLDRHYLANPRSGADLEKIRQFVFRSLLADDFWTGAVDPVLMTCRRVIYGQARGAHFPLDALAQALAAKPANKQLVFLRADVQRLLGTRYRDRNALLLLTAIFPEAGRNRWDHKDHVFPRARFTEGVLRRAGIAPSRTEELRGLGEQLPNLCLLPSTENIVKSARPPHEWLELVRKNNGGGARSSRVRFLDLQQLPADFSGFELFHAKRKARLEVRLKRVLGV
jgi:alkylhydroperoxidase family enzyme